MAIPIELVPQRVAAANSLRPGMVLTREQREAVVWWKDQRLPVAPLSDVKKTLPSGKTWSKDLEVLSNLETSCLEIWREGEFLVEVYFRFDVRELSVELLETAVRFCRDLECWLITDNGKVIEPILSVVKEEIEESPAYRFMKDPIKFISSRK
ncbi:MAG: hypothetical protein IT391_08490 [Nitrospira sp.]|nr:hypothetical protein [Nitrospira sp.]